MRFSLVFVLSLLHLCRGQSNDFGSGRGFHHRRPLHQSPCSWSGAYAENHYDSVEEDVQGRKLFLVAGAAVGGAALGYHLGMKHKVPIIINNNIHNDYPSPCVASQHGGIGGGGLLSHHPILSSILQGGLWDNGGGGVASAAGNRLPVNRQTSGINWNRAIRQFNRAVRPLTRVFR